MQYELKKISIKIDEYIKILNEEVKNLAGSESPALIKDQQFLNAIIRSTKFRQLRNNINAALEKNPDQQIEINLPDEFSINMESLYQQIPALKEALKEDVPLSELLTKLQQFNRHLNESSNPYFYDDELKNDYINLEKDLERFINNYTNETNQTIRLNRPLDRNSIEEQYKSINEQISVQIPLDQLSMKINALLNENPDQETKLHLEDIKIAIKTIPPQNRATTTLLIPGGLETDAEGLTRQKSSIMNELEKNGADLNGGSIQKRNELIAAINEELFKEKQLINDLLRLDKLIKEENPSKTIEGKFSASQEQIAKKNPNPTSKQYNIKFFQKAIESHLEECIEKIGHLQEKSLKLYLDSAEYELNKIISELQAEDSNLIPGNFKLETFLIKIRNDKEKIIKEKCDGLSDIIPDGPVKKELQKTAFEIDVLIKAGENMIKILDTIEQCPESFVKKSSINIKGLENIIKNPETVIEQIEKLKKDYFYKSKNNEYKSNYKPDKTPPSNGPKFDR